MKARVATTDGSPAGVIDYPLLVAGPIADIVGMHSDTLLTIPGIVIERALPCWLVIKGFQHAAHGQES